MSDITVNDKRLFTKDGEIKERGEPTTEKAQTAEPSRGTGPGPDLGAIKPTMATLVLALATSVMIHLGESPPEDDGPPRVDLPQAKHAIDLLGVLEEKTRGNLDETEEQLLKTLLYDLRIKYVTLLKK
ncbi:MAG: DUF1844 domain-containing protein [Deltaproteobacteria bacterium]|nr:DUF1844 domain-containing protein [Deltaproteobacteria bacterium]